MSENDAMARLSALQGEIVETKREIQTRKPDFRLIFDRAPIRNLEGKLDTSYETFIELDRAIGASIKIPDDINSKLMVAASFSILNGARNSVRTILSESYQDIASLKSQLNFYASLIVALLALLVSVIGIFA